MRTVPFVLFGVLVLGVFLAACQAPVAQVGDKVTFDYTLRFSDGRLAETTSREIAVNEGKLIAGKNYTALKVELGTHKALKGIEAKLLGMRAGETRSFILTPEEGYGPYHPNLVGTIKSRKEFPLYMEFNETVDFKRSSYPGLDPGNVFQPAGYPFKYVTLSVNNETVHAKALNVSINDTVPTPGLPWNSQVVSVGKTIVIEALVPEGGKIPTALGDIVMHRNETSLESVLDKVVGDLVHAPNGGTGRVVKVTHDEIFVDANNPLANETLNATITLRSISAAS